MPKLILKCRYLKPTAAPHSENLVRYIATRDGVEKLDESWRLLPATKAQKKLIEQIVSDFPDTLNSFEYQDYLRTTTKGAASELITRAIEDNIDSIGMRENYVEYIAKRPRVERLGSHGLFTDDNTPVNLSEAASAVANHNGNVWTNIFSLHREDAVRLGYDQGTAWRNLIRSQADAMATAMKISLTDLRWYAAFHNESHHPHVHVVAYSAGKEPYLTEQGIERMKSAFAREIFKQDLMQSYIAQTKYRNEIASESRDLIAEIVEQINNGSYENETLELMLRKLSDYLKKHKGKKVYGYLPQTARNLVNGIVDEMEKDSRISALYDLWYERRNAILKTYTDNLPLRVPLSQNKELRSVKNVVIREAQNIPEDRITFEDELGETDTPAPDLPRQDFEEDLSIPIPNNRKDKWTDLSSMFYQYLKAREYLDQGSEQYDPVEAVRWLRLSAEQGFDTAMYRLGKLFLYGNEVEKDVGYGLHWLWQAEAMNNPYAQYLLGKTYLKGEDVAVNFVQAETLFEKASLQGIPCAKYSLAGMHLDGLAEQSSTEKALQLLRESAGRGFVWAEYALGKILMHGELTEKDASGAMRLLTSAAEKKNSQAQYLLAKLLMSGNIPSDMDKALYWLRQSAEQENQYAQYQLGKMYLYGQYVAKDYESAVMLLAASAGQGNIYAKRILETYRPYSSGTGTTLAPLRLLTRIAQIFRDELKKDNSNRALIERKLRQKMEEKKQAHGLKMG